MATLTGNTIASTYLPLLRITNNTMGVAGTAYYIKDSADTNSALSISTTRVGIGTAAPSVALDIQGAGALGLRVESADNNAFAILDAHTGADAYILCREAGANEWAFGLDGSDTNKWKVSEGSTIGTNDRLVIMEGGNVGIGTASPATILELESAASETALGIDNTAGDGDVCVRYKLSGSTTFMHGVDDTDDKFKIGTTSLASPKITLQSDGNVGIGTTSPTQQLDVTKDVASAEFIALHLGNQQDDNDTSGSVSIQFSPDTQQDNAAKISVGKVSDFSTSGNCDSYMSFHTIQDNSMSEKMRIMDSGNVGIGKTNPGEKFNVTGDASGGTALVQFENTHDSVVDNDHVLMLAFGGDAGVTEGNFIIFRDNDTAEMGVIKANSATVVVDSYSDYRIKNTIATLSGGLTRVNALRPVTFKYNTDSGNATHEGFIAHEVQEHVPYAVRGAKDAVKDDGSVKAQSFCIYQLIPQLVSAIQELSAKVTALENA